MASPDPSGRFRLALVQSAEHLEDKDVTKLAYLCEEISPSKKATITNGIQLFTELESLNRLSEDDVTTLIGWMDSLQLRKAAQPLKEYRQHAATKGDAQSSKMRRAEKLPEEIQEALSQVNSAKELWEKKKREIMTNPAKSKLDLANLFREMEHIQDLKHQIEYLKRRRDEPSCNGLLELQKDEEEISKIKRRVKTTMVSVLVGGVCLDENVMSNIYDNRRCDGGVLLVFIDPTDPSKEYLRHTVKVDDHQSPVVMSNTSLGYDGINHPLFAVGTTVYIVRPHYVHDVIPGLVTDYVESVTLLVIGEVPDGASITSITVRYKPVGEPMKPEKEFLISISGSTVLRGYDVTRSLLRSIETSDHVPTGGITGIAYNGDTVAVIGSGSDEVILLACGGTAGSTSTAGPRSSGPVQQCGSLRPPAGLSPVIGMWTGICWLLLCTSSGNAGQWSVVHYDKTGKLLKVWVKGASSSDLDVPVSFTRWKRTGYVTLPNSSIRAVNLPLSPGV